ncbi:MAG: alpha-N-acetylglucosaminidase [Paludibacter sp.]|nr:alpha-N-acetylglucosaminidase [Paludibacter sp.]
MNKFLSYFIIINILLFFLGLNTALAGKYSENNTEELIERVLPNQQNQFLLEIIKTTNDSDIIEVDRSKNKIVLRGNNSLSLAVAFNTYLKEVALISYDWQADKPIKIRGKLPLPENRIKRVCKANERFFNNTCTFGYTFPYWNWKQWERFIDWMAMNGINRPLMLAGQEAIWLKVWRSFGLAEKQILLYFSSPAHLPWHRMANMDGWGGPLPLSYIENQKRLQQRILGRCRSLGMKPVLSAFAGHVPKELRKLFPKVKITAIDPGWGGMDSIYTTCYLDPTEPLFVEIQKRFLTIQRKTYGTDHLYSADPFNEITPPSWEPEYLSKVAETIYNSMETTDSVSTWYQMSWTFYYDSMHWTQPRLSALVHAVPKGKLIFLDYVCEEEEYFRKSESFEGAPFIWCYLGNFGGNTHLVSPIRKVLRKINNISVNSSCVGVGSTLEGINVNPVIYESVLENPWLNPAEKGVDLIIQKYADRRSGQKDENIRKAWKILNDKVFVDSAVGIWNHSVIFQVLPVTDLSKRFWSTNPDIPYDNKDLLQSVELLLNANQKSKSNGAYQFDLVNLTRQLLGNYGMVLYHKMMKAYQQKDGDDFHRISEEFLTLGSELDSLLGTRHEFLLGRWLADARNMGRSQIEKRYFERDAREIITTWHKAGGGLTDYSNRQWNGLISSYYLPRWKKFISLLRADLNGKIPFDEKAFSTWCITFEQNWVDHCNESFREEPIGNPLELTECLVGKYRYKIMNSM